MNAGRDATATDPSSPTARLLIALYEAFNARDIEGALAALHPDVDWPNGMDGGRMRGRGSVQDYWRRQWRVIDPRVMPLHIADDASGRTVVEVHQVVRDPAGNILSDQIVQHIYTIRDGLIGHMDIHNGSMPRAST